MGISFPRLKIHLARYEDGIFPWIQERLYTPFWRYYWNPTPGGVLDFRGEAIELTPDTVTIIPGYLSFSTRARVPFSQYYIHFCLPETVMPPENPVIYRIPFQPEWRAKWETFREVAADPAAVFRRAALAESLLLTALLELPEELLRVVPERDPRIERACRTIAARLDDPPDNAELAKLAGLNRESFIRLFHRECAESPGVLSRRLRVEHACRLLHYSNRSIDEIATQCGFADRYHFSRVFSRLMHCAPAAFRKLRH